MVRAEATTSLNVELFLGKSNDLNGRHDPIAVHLLTFCARPPSPNLPGLAVEKFRACSGQTPDQLGNFLKQGGLSETSAYLTARRKGINCINR